MLRSSQITKWTDVSPKLLKRSSRRGRNDLLSITNAAQTTSLFGIASHLRGEVMWFWLWRKQTCSWLHPGCGTFIVLALGVISVAYACFRELHASVLFSGFQVTFQVIWGYGKRRQNWLQTDCCGATEHQEPCRNEFLLSSAALTFLRGSGKVFLPSSAQPLRSRRQGDFWGVSLLTHTPVIVSSWVTFPSCWCRPVIKRH